MKPYWSCTQRKSTIHHFLALLPHSFSNTGSNFKVARPLGGSLFKWWIADVTPIPKGPLSALVCNYRPISITPVLSKVFERLIALRFGRFLERSGVLPSHQYSYRKRLGTCDALLEIVCAGQLELDRGGELALVQIDISAAIMGALCLNCGKLE